MIRLNKYLADCGVASRRACDKFIAAGRVSINGEVVRELGTRISAKDHVTVNGQPVNLQKRKIYVLLHKPKGYITSVGDDRGRKTVLDLVKIQERIFPVGRLDIDSTGLIILTNDGRLAHRLMHPRFKISKTYRVSLEKQIDLESLQQLKRGVVLDDGPTLPCNATYIGKSHKDLKVELREGRQRQLRRMFAALGFEVLQLIRIQFGPLKIGGLRQGMWRFLEKDEVELLYKAIDLHKTFR